MLNIGLFFLDYVVPSLFIVYGLLMGFRCLRFLFFARRRLRELDTVPERDFIE